MPLRSLRCLLSLLSPGDFCSCLTDTNILSIRYNIIKGFAAKASEEALETVQALGATHNVVIEEDQTVSINNE